jgi:hypothetical protein
MGTYGTGLYGNDTAMDLRDELRLVVRTPWDGQRLAAWAAGAYPAIADPADEQHSDVALALADQFWLYGIDHAPTFRRARDIVTGGTDLASKQALGMSGGDLRRRARTLEVVLAKWQQPNPRPRARRILSTPEPFVLQPGDCLVYPVADGAIRNPYVGPRKAERFFAVHRWVADGWGSLIVLDAYHRHDVLARYIVALLANDDDRPPGIDEIPGLHIRHTRHIGLPAGSPARRRVHAVHTTRIHLERMRMQAIGNLAVDPMVVASHGLTFGTPPLTFDTDLANAAHTSLSNGQAPHVDDPVALYLVA